MLLFFWCNQPDVKEVDSTSLTTCKFRTITDILLLLIFVQKDCWFLYCLVGVKLPFFSFQYTSYLKTFSLETITKTYLILSLNVSRGILLITKMFPVEYTPWFPFRHQNRKSQHNIPNNSHPPTKFSPSLYISTAKT